MKSRSSSQHAGDLHGRGTVAAKVVRREDAHVHGYTWLGLRKVTWVDPSGKERAWEAAYRKTRAGDVDGVTIIGFIRYPKSRQPDEVLCVTQFRPPVAAQVLECPAGLLEKDETIEQGALRELREETGYYGVVTDVSPIVPCDPGMSDANMRYVSVEIDGDNPVNVNPAQNPEPGEFITVKRFPADQLLATFDEAARRGCQVDARLYGIALGFRLGMDRGENLCTLQRRTEAEIRQKAEEERKKVEEEKHRLAEQRRKTLLEKKRSSLQQLSGTEPNEGDVDVIFEAERMSTTSAMFCGALLAAAAILGSQLHWHWTPGSVANLSWRGR